MAKSDITAINAKTISINSTPIAGSAAAYGPYTTYDQLDADTVLALNGVVIQGTMTSGLAYTNIDHLNVLSGVSVADVVKYGTASTPASNAATGPIAIGGGSVPIGPSPTPTPTPGIPTPLPAPDPIVGDVMAIRFRDATQLDPHNNGTNTVGIDGNGIFAEVTYKGIAAPSVNGTAYDALFPPERIKVLVADNTFTKQGQPSFLYRYIYLTAQVRAQFKGSASDTAQRFLTQNGSDFTTIYAGSDIVYRKTRMIAAWAEAGAYTNGGVVSNACMIKALTNSSAVEYEKPTWDWHNAQHLTNRGSTAREEGSAWHTTPMGGQQVPCVKFQAHDAAGNLKAEELVSDPSLSTLVTRAGAIKPEVFGWDKPTASFDQAAKCWSNVLVYPWIGDADAIYDLSKDGINTGFTRIDSVLPHTRLRSIIDKAGTYSAVAYVDANSSGSGGAVANTLAAARPTPFKTPEQAFAAIRAYNVTMGHDDYAGGRIYFGNNTTSLIAYGAVSNISSPSAMGWSWCELLTDPAATGPVSWTGKASVVQIPSMTSCSMVIQESAQSPWTTFNDPASGAGLSMIRFDSHEWQPSVAGRSIAGATGVYGYAIQYHSNGYSANGNLLGVAGPGSDPRALALALGNVHGSRIGPLGAQVFVGNVAGMPDDNSLPAITDGYFIHHNYFSGGTGPANTLRSQTRPTVKYCNLVEFFGANGGVVAWNDSADGKFAPVFMFLSGHNAIYGNRGSSMYADVTEARGVKKSAVMCYNIFTDYNIKSDDFTDGGARSNPGNVGNHQPLYQVRYRGNISLLGSRSGDTPGPGSYLGMYWPKNSIFKFTNTVATAKATVVNWQAVNSDATVTPGGGDYHHAGATNPSYGKVPAVYAAYDPNFTNTISGGVLKYDLDGKLRRQDGTGASGPYERTQ